MDAELCHMHIAPFSTRSYKPALWKARELAGCELLYQPTGFPNMSLHHRCGENKANLLCLEAAKTVLARLAPLITS